MPAFRKLPLAFLALFLVALVAFPTSGFCDDTTMPPSTDMGSAAPGASGQETDTQGAVMTNAQIQTCNTTIKQTAASVAHEKSTYIQSAFQSLDVKAQYCWDQINAMFSFAGATGDPLNLLWGAIESMITTYITNIANQVCSAALSVASQLKQFGESQFNRLCVPLSNFGLNLNVNLGLTGPPCNGTQLLPIGQMFSTTRPPTYDPSTMIPQGSSSPVH